MPHHAYVIEDSAEQGTARALAYVSQNMGLPTSGNPDVLVLAYGLLSVEAVRKLADLATRAPVAGTQKVIIASTHRLFHEAQNALLKLCEEPPADTTLFLIVPSTGMLLDTLRSRLQPLPDIPTALSYDTETTNAFIAAGKQERAHIVATLLEQHKSDKEEEKQAARVAAIRLTNGLTRAAHDAYLRTGNTTLVRYLADLNVFTPILYERSAPLKPICEHLLITTPAQFE